MPTSTAPARNALPVADFDLTEDILDALAARKAADFSPSEIARLVKSDTRDVHRVLPYLVADRNVSTTDRGTWSRYRFIQGYWQD